jgi:hypothetical protein
MRSQRLRLQPATGRLLRVSFASPTMRFAMSASVRQVRKARELDLTSARRIVPRTYREFYAV